MRRRRRRRDQPRVEIRERGLPDETRTRRASRPSHHHRRITEAAPPPTNNHSIHHKFIHDHCCSSVSSNCVFYFCPPPKQSSYSLLGGGTAGERDGGGVVSTARYTARSTRRFFRTCLEFFAVQKNAFQVFPSYRATSSVIPQRFGGFHIWGRRGQDQPRPPLHLPSTAPRRIKCVTDERERVFNI